MMDGASGQQPSDAAGPLLVIGQPHYTRSIGLRTDRHYFIRNLEAPYQEVVVNRAPDASARRLLSAECETVQNASLCRLPPVDVEPRWIIADVGVTSGCQSRVGVSMAPGLVVLPPVETAGALRIEFGTARLDSAFVTIEPASCGRAVRWTFRRWSPTNSAQAQGEVLATGLARQLTTPRTRLSADEVYDIRRDPAMTSPLALNETESAQLRRSLESRFAALMQPATQPQGFDRAEIERLRSLGYIR